MVRHDPFDLQLTVTALEIPIFFRSNRPVKGHEQSLQRGHLVTVVSVDGASPKLGGLYGPHLKALRFAPSTLKPSETTVGLSLMSSNCTVALKGCGCDVQGVDLRKRAWKFGSDRFNNMQE